jgi:hypothetical protein
LIECKKLAGEVVRSLTLFEDGSDGPEVSMEFTGGTVFSVCLKASIEAKHTCDEGGEPVVLKDYSSPATPR